MGIVNDLNGPPRNSQTDSLGYSEKFVNQSLEGLR